MDATYINSTKFSITGDATSGFIEGRRVYLDCGSDGVFYSTIVSSTYSDPDTEVTIEDSVLTSNLKDVLYGVVSSGSYGSLPEHYHDGSPGNGGDLNIPTHLVDLDDTPDTYSGIEGNYLRVTSSGLQATDGVILTASDNSEWLVKVTNSGTLYTTSYS